VHHATDGLMLGVLSACPPGGIYPDTQAEGEVVRLPAAQEDPLDLAVFFADEHRGLFKLLYFVTGNRADAAELMQDAFLKLWERRDRVDRITDPGAYLFRAALNGSRMRARAARRAALRLVPIASSYDPFDEVHLRENVKQLLLALSPASAPPSSCWTCTAAARTRPLGSWGSAVDRAGARHAGPCRNSGPREARMPELREVFEMTTKQMEPDVDTRREQEGPQRRSARNKKIGSLAVAAAIELWQQHTREYVEVVRQRSGAGTSSP
jgi:hypothetical protein